MGKPSIPRTLKKYSKHLCQRIAGASLGICLVGKLRNKDMYSYVVPEDRNRTTKHSPEREGVIAKSKWGSSIPDAIGIAITLYATAQVRF